MINLYLQKVDVDINEKGVKFTSDAHGAQGLNKYTFDMDVYGTIDSKVSTITQFLIYMSHMGLSLLGSFRSCYVYKCLRPSYCKVA